MDYIRFQLMEKYIILENILRMVAHYLAFKMVQQVIIILAVVEVEEVQLGILSQVQVVLVVGEMVEHLIPLRLHQGLPTQVVEVVLDKCIMVIVMVVQE